jgi:hypothetical protein
MKAELFLVLIECVLLLSVSASEQKFSQENAFTEKGVMQQNLTAKFILDKIDNTTMIQKDRKMCSFLVQEILQTQNGIQVINNTSVYSVTIFLNDSSKENIAKLRSLVQDYRPFRQDIPSLPPTQKCQLLNYSRKIFLIAPKIS